MDSPLNHLPHAAPCPHGVDAALSLYLDGELPYDEQAAFFAHLAACEPCRRTLDALLQFRRLLREEHLALPAAADDAFFLRLAEHKEVTAEAQPSPDRPPLLRARMTLTVQGALALAAFLFLAGMLLPRNGLPADAASAQLVSGEEELVDLNASHPALREARAVYVFYPGLVVEADKDQEPPPPETL